ncbi:MAG: IS21 family transposase [Acidobacteriota bacterium]
MIPPEPIAEIRRLFFAEHWKVGTIAAALGLHPDTVRDAVETDRFNRAKIVRASTLTDPYSDFIRQTLERYPRLRATRIYQMVRTRGYAGSVVQLRRVVARLRPPQREAFLALRTFPGEEAQADWAHFGEVCVGQARRRLSCFVLTLSYSRALALEFFFDQSLENFLRGHVRAFAQLGGVARTILYDNLRSAVLERRGDAVHFHPRLLELCAHYHFAARPCRPGRGSEKGRVERAIRYVRESFFAARPFTTLADFNRQARTWRDEIAHRRPWPGGDRRTVAEIFEEEQARLLPLPAHPFDTDLVRPVRSEKTISVRFDLNDYSIPPTAVGRPLTLVASDTDLRLLDGTVEIARHRRSYDRHERIEDPAHQQALLEDKRKAVGSTRNSRLTSAVPEIEALLDAAFRRGEPAGPQTTQLLLLLDDYGASELRAAVCEALERGTPRASSVAYILSRRHRLRRGRTPLPVDLTRRPDLADLHVQPHNPETYDELTRDHDPDE